MLSNNKLIAITVIAFVTVLIVSIIESIVSSILISTFIFIWRWSIEGKVIEIFGVFEGGNKGIDIVGSKG